jgi:hypothetical protein
MCHPSSPTAAQLTERLCDPRVAANLRQPLALARAALHLLTPAVDPLDIAVRTAFTPSGVVWEWRGQVAPLPLLDAAAFLSPFSIPLDQLAGYLAQLADAVASHPARRDDDEYLDLDDASPVALLKVVRSGARVIAFGADILLGAPLIAFELEAQAPPSRALLDAVIASLSASPHDPTGTVYDDDRTYMVTGTPGSVLVRPTPMSVPPCVPEPGYPSPELVEGLGIEIAEDLSGRLALTVDLPEPDGTRSHVEYLITLTAGYEALLAAHIDTFGAAFVGYTRPWSPIPVGHEDRVPHLAGWHVEGPAIDEPGWVATNDVTKLRALLRPSTSPALLDA